MKTGWWRLTFTGVDELTDEDKIHISEGIVAGCEEGEILQEEDDSDDKYTNEGVK